MKNFPFDDKTKGHALLTALFVMSLVSIISLGISLRLKLNTWHTQLAKDELEQVNLFRREALSKVIHYLQDQTDHALPLFENKDNYQIIVHDLAGRFNINSFFSHHENDIALFRRLLSLNAIKQEEQKAIIEQIKQWATARGSHYFTDIALLSPILGKHYFKIAPYLCALTTAQNQINFLDSSPILLQTYYPKLDFNTAKRLSDPKLDSQEKRKRFAEYEIQVLPENTLAQFIEISVIFNQSKTFKQLLKIDQNHAIVLSEKWI